MVGLISPTGPTSDCGVTHHDASDSDWSPAGIGRPMVAGVAFTSDRDGNGEIYVMGARMGPTSEA